MKFVVIPELRWQASDGTVAPVTAAAVTDGAIGSAQLADNAVEGTHIAPGSVDTTHLGDGVIIQPGGTPDGVRMFLEMAAAGEDAPVLFGEDTSTISIGSTDVSAWLECVDFELPFVGGSSPFTSPESPDIWRPARFILRIGKSTPWIFAAAADQRNIDLKLHLFPPPDEAGQAEEKFQYRIQQGRIVSARIIQQNHSLLQTTRGPFYVEILVRPNVLEIESLTGGTLFVDTWTGTPADDPFVFPAATAAVATIPPGEFGTHLHLSASGEDAPIQFGEDTTTHQVGATDVSDMIECVAFEMRIDPLEIAAKKLPPVRLLLRPGKSTPWIFDAAHSKKNITLTLYFFRRRHETSEIEQNFQYRIPSSGRILTARFVQQAGSGAPNSESSFWVEIFIHPTESAILESITGGTMAILSFQ